MKLGLLRAVAAIDLLNVLAVTGISRAHGGAAASGYAPAAVAVLLVHRNPLRRRVGRALCLAGLVPNTLLSVRASSGTRRSRALSGYVAAGGAVLGALYLHGLRD